MIKISVERPTTHELSIALIELGRLLAAEPMPALQEGKPARQRKPAATPAPAPSETQAPQGNADSSPTASETPASAPVEQPSAPASQAGGEESAAAPAQDSAPAPAVDYDKLRAEVRTVLTKATVDGKQAAVSALVHSFAPMLSKVQDDQLAALLAKAKEL